LLDGVVVPVKAALKAAARPSSYPGHLREAASTVVTAGLWPLGVVDRGLAELRRMTVGAGSHVDTPVLLLHGYGANKSNWLFVQRYLRDAGFGRVHALNYNPFIADVPTSAARCVDRARRLMDHVGVDRVHLVGHSLGGVVARYAVQLGGLTEAGVCITVASPHKGAPLARLGAGATARQLRSGSAVLRRLSASSRRLPTRFVAYYSNLDVIVPARVAMITEPALRAVNICVKDEGHLSILLSRRLASSVVDQLAAAEGLPGFGAPVGAFGPAVAGHEAAADDEAMAAAE